MDLLRVVIVDDEVLARENIAALLQADPEISVVAECGDGQQALEAVRQHAPDVLFLDVQLPGMDGFDVLAQLPRDRMPQVVFVTARDQYAVRAFEVNATDYLLKPFSRQRFAAALAKVKSAARARERRDLAERVETILATLQEMKASPLPTSASAVPFDAGAEGEANSWGGRLLFRSDGEIHVLSTDEIRWIESEGDYVKIHAGQKAKLVRMSLVRILQKLDPAHFVRIHRSTVVNLTHVRKVSPALYGEYTVELADASRLKVSRTYVHSLKAYL